MSVKFYNIVSLHLIVLIFAFIAIGHESRDYGKLCILKGPSPYTYDSGRNCAD